MQFLKIPIPIARKVIGNSEVRGVSKAKVLEESMKVNWNFQKGGRVKTKKKTFREGYGYFLGQNNKTRTINLGKRSDFFAVYEMLETGPVQITRINLLVQSNGLLYSPE